MLKEEFPRLFSISQNKDSEVYDLVDWRQLKWKVYKLEFKLEKREV